MWVPFCVLAAAHLASVVFLLIAGYVLLVLPARDRPHCLVPARCTHFGLVAGHAIEGVVAVVSWGQCGWLVVPGVGLLVGGTAGFVTGQLARVVLVRDE